MGESSKYPVEIILVEPVVWEAALELAEGDRSRLLVEAFASVVVLNNHADGGE